MQLQIKVLLCIHPTYVATSFQSSSELHKGPTIRVVLLYPPGGIQLDVLLSLLRAKVVVLPVCQWQSKPAQRRHVFREVFSHKAAQTQCDRCLFTTKTCVTILVFGFLPILLLFLLAMASNIIAMASNLLAMASPLIAKQIRTCVT